VTIVGVDIVEVNRVVVSAHLLRDRVQRMEYLYREFACGLVVKC
jgi:hypothetical protein